MGVPRAQLRGQPGVTIRNVSSFTTEEQEALAPLLLTFSSSDDVCFLLAGNAWKRASEVMSYELNEG